jgi:hypothetical protein
MEARKIRDEDDARRCLAAATTSGRPRAAWAREHGVDARSLNAWRLTLERSVRRAPPRLAELVTAVAAPPPPVYRVRCGAFEVETTGDFDDVSCPVPSTPPSPVRTLKRPVHRSAEQETAARGASWTTRGVVERMGVELLLHELGADRVDPDDGGVVLRSGGPQRGFGCSRLSAHHRFSAGNDGQDSVAKSRPIRVRAAKGDPGVPPAATGTRQRGCGCHGWD